MNVERDQYFALREGKLEFAGRPLPQAVVDETHAILREHQVPARDERWLTLSLIYTIANQRSRYEPPLRFLNAIRNAPLASIKDPAYLAAVARGQEIGLLHDDRFGPALAFCAARPGGIEQLADDYFARPFETRRELVKEVKWLAHKTASFWYLCLGGRGLMTLDVHNYRQLGGMGLDVDPGHYIGERRRDKNGRTVVTSPSPREYERIEMEAIAALGGEEALHVDGTLHAGFATTLFWTVGAKAFRGIDPLQEDFFGSATLQFVSPFTRIMPLKEKKGQAPSAPAAQQTALFSDAA